MQVIQLPQTGLAQGKSVKLSIVDEDGNPVKDNNNVDITDISLTFDTTLSLYSASLIISASEPDGYIRLYFYSTDGTDISSDYYPLDARLENVNITPIAEIVPFQYMVDYFLATGSKGDPEFTAAINSYISDKDSLRRALMSAQNDLEIALEMFIAERTWVENRDNYFERFQANLWQVQASYVPINELVSVNIYYGTTPIANIGKELFTFDRIQGLIEFLPLPGGDSASLYTMLIQNISGMGLAIINGGWLDRIPNMFNFTYKTGLIYKQVDSNGNITSQTDPIEKEGIRQALCRRALINLSNMGIDPAGRKTGEGESIDGASNNVSYSMDPYVKRLKAEEDAWVIKMQRKYAKNVIGVVV